MPPGVNWRKGSFNLMYHVVTVCAIICLISIFAFFVCAARGQAYKSYVAPAGENELRFQKPVWVPISAILLCVTFTSGALAEIAMSQPDTMVNNVLRGCLFFLPGPFIASFLAPESLAIDLTGRRYTRYRTWFHLKSSGPLSDFYVVNILTSNRNGNPTYFCRLVWHGGSHMCIGTFSWRKPAQDLAQQMSTTLKVPITNEQQTIN